MIDQKLYSILGTLEGEVGIYFEDIQTGEKILINPDSVFSAASTVKIPLVSLLFQEVSEGKINLNDIIELSEENRVGGTGIIKNLDKRYKPTVLDLATLAIIVSDNAATNQLVDLVGGLEGITKYCDSIGLTNTKFQRKMMDIKAKASGKDNLTTARDMGNILAKLARNEIVSANASRQIVDIMKSQQLRSKLPAYIPAIDTSDPADHHTKITHGTVMVANKTGDLDRVQHDVGIFILPGNNYYILTMFTSNLSADSEGIRAIGEVSKAIYEEMAAKYQYKKEN
ncbi:serine hydrolase [Clostridium peptidivorans]|uniref:serine hydrolase n=1 Tax=Clostridium peptidivorans TaxID=100174 RepID=UPI000BE3CF99|nr:serine hydrolase [Clostridium peptidivorans]